MRPQYQVTKVSSFPLGILPNGEVAMGTQIDVAIQWPVAVNFITIKCKVSPGG
jgi:hypothetical protein